MTRFHIPQVCMLLGILMLSLADQSTWAQDDLIQSGPMIGHVSMRSAQFWVQTTQPAQVHLEYSPTDRASDVVWNSSEGVLTAKSSGCTAHLELTGLEPGTDYEVAF